jgi:hypothetical protein
MNIDHGDWKRRGESGSALFKLTLNLNRFSVTEEVTFFTAENAEYAEQARDHHTVPRAKTQEKRYLPIVILPAKKPKMSSLVFLDRNKFSHRLAALSDDDGLALGLNLVHDGEATGFESAGRDNFHEGKTFVIMLIVRWSQRGGSANFISSHRQDTSVGLRTA